MPFTHGHALIIGVGSYRHEPQVNVSITAADAQAVATVLRDPRFCGYPDAQVTLLTDAGATRASILAALTDLAARTTPDAAVLLFSSGHGEYSAGGVYQLTTHDTRLAQRKVVAGTAISQPELLAKLRAILARRLVLLVNACHAGERSPVLGESDQPFTGQPFPQHTADAILATGSGRIIITACREHQVAYIGPGPLTIFAQALTDGLRGQGLSGRAGYISVFDLYTHLSFAVGDAVAQRVPAELRRRYGEAQEPELTVLKGVGPFPIALFRGAPSPRRLPDRPRAAGRRCVARGDPGAQPVGAGAIDQRRQSRRHRGSVSESTIITGDRNTVIQSSGEYVGGDRITTGDISGVGIAIGRGAQSHVQQGDGDHETFEAQS